MTKTTAQHAARIAGQDPQGRTAEYQVPFQLDSIARTPPSGLTPAHDTAAALATRTGYAAVTLAGGTEPGLTVAVAPFGHRSHRGRRQRPVFDPRRDGFAGPNTFQAATSDAAGNWTDVRHRSNRCSLSSATSTGGTTREDGGPGGSRGRRGLRLRGGAARRRLVRGGAGDDVRGAGRTGGRHVPLRWTDVRHVGRRVDPRRRRGLAGGSERRLAGPHFLPAAGGVLQRLGRRHACVLGTKLDGRQVTLDLSGIPGGTQATFRLRLVNNDADRATSVQLTDFDLLYGAGEGPTSAVVSSADYARTENIDFGSLSDITPSVRPRYGTTSFDEAAELLFADLALSNEGGFLADTPLLLAIDRISDPSVVPTDFDGRTPDGLPYSSSRRWSKGERLTPESRRTSLRRFP